MEDAELAERRSLTSRLIRHLTKPDDPSYTLPAKYVGVCLRAILLAEAHQIHATVHTPCGLTRTAGEIIAMFRLQSFVDWSKAVVQTLDRSLPLEQRLRRRDGYAERVQRRYSNRVWPKGVTGCW